MKLSLGARYLMLPLFVLFVFVHDAIAQDGALDSAPAEDKSAERELARLLGPLESFQADFQQTLISAQGKALQETRGQLKGLRPGFFYWETEPPIAQVLVVDGEQIWIYDPDLEQVTVQPMAEQGGNAPALLLSGQMDKIAALYRISFIESESRDAAAESSPAVRPDFRLVPRQADSLFEVISLHFVGGSLSAMTISDSLGQKTYLRFSNVEVNPNLGAADFYFEVPEGVDVIRQSEF